MRLVYSLQGLIIFLLLNQDISYAQRDSSYQRLKIFEQAPSFHKGRFWGLTGVAASSYTAVTIGLDRAWYANYPRGRFQFFDDRHEWRYMDKMGHTMTTYFESKWMGDFYEWAGVRKSKARWIGFGSGMLFQTTLEMLDGFSTQWGFSWADMGFNLAGGGLYLGQELAWSEQRIKLKMSVHRPHYSQALIPSIDDPTVSSTLERRAQRLYGTSLPELFFKEYNGQTIWASVNIASFCKNKPKWLPEWLNIAGGYGIGNVFGARGNSWEEDGYRFEAPAAYRPYSQYYLSFDIDFEQIPVKQRGWKVLFGFLNVFKVPLPTLEVNTLGQVRFHPLYF